MTNVEYFPAAAPPPQPETHEDENRPAPTRDVDALLSRSIHVRQSRTIRLMTMLLGLIVVSALAALWLGHFAKSETMRGVVSTVSGSARLSAPRDGVIDRILVRQGDKVAVGQPVAVLRLAETTTNGQTTNAAEVRSLGQQRQNFEAEVRRNNDIIRETEEALSATSEEEQALEVALAEQEKSISAGLDLERDAVEKLTGLAKDGYATVDMLNQHRRILFQYERDMADLRLRRLDAERQSTGRDRDLRAALTDRTAARDSANNQLTDIDLRLTQLKAEGVIEVVAQTAGEVLTIAGKPGESIVAGQLIAVVGNPIDELLVILDAPAGSIGLTKVGQKVVLKYDAFPFKSFGIAYGTISAISLSAVRPAEKKADATDSRPTALQSIYRIEVKPDRRTVLAYGAEQPIAIGSTLSAEIVVERRRLIDWVLDPIRAMEGRT